jgi:hypothetical protein
MEDEVYIYMYQRNILRALSTVFFLAMSHTAFAWTQNVELGYGYSHDPNAVYYSNSGFLLSSDVAPLHVDTYTHWSLNLAVGKFRTTAPFNRYLTTAAAALELRLYPIACYTNTPVYLLGSVGPAYMSTEKFGVNTQGSHMSGQWIGGLGVEYKSVDVNFHIVHYSNAKTVKPDQGFSVLYMLSVGYLFGC